MGHQRTVIEKRYFYQKRTLLTRALSAPPKAGPACRTGGQRVRRSPPVLKGSPPAQQAAGHTAGAGGRLQGKRGIRPPNPSIPQPARADTCGKTGSPLSGPCLGPVWPHTASVRAASCAGLPRSRTAARAPSRRCYRQHPKHHSKTAARAPSRRVVRPSCCFAARVAFPAASVLRSGRSAPVRFIDRDRVLC